MTEDELKEAGVSEDNIPKVMSMHQKSIDNVYNSDDFSQRVTTNTNASLNKAAGKIFEGIGIKDFKRNEGEQTSDFISRGVSHYVDNKLSGVKSKDEEISRLTKSLADNSPEEIKKAAEQEAENKYKGLYAQQLAEEVKEKDKEINKYKSELSDIQSSSLITSASRGLFDSEKIKSNSSAFNDLMSLVTKGVRDKYDLVEDAGKAYAQEKDGVKRIELSQLFSEDDRLKMFKKEDLPSGVGSKDTRQKQSTDKVGSIKIIQDQMKKEGFTRDRADEWSKEFFKRFKEYNKNNYICLCK